MAKLSIAQLKSIVASYVAATNISNDTLSVTRDNIVGLADKIGKIQTIQHYFTDKLEVLTGEDLSFGKTVEEWAIDLILPEAYDSTGASALSRHDQTFRPVYYSFTCGRKMIPMTLPYNNIERAVHNEGQFAEVVAAMTKSLYDSEAMLRYGIKRQALGRLAGMCAYNMDATNATSYSTTGVYSVGTLLKDSGDAGKVFICVKPKTATSMTWADAKANGYVVENKLVEVKALPVDTSTGEAFIEAVKCDVEIASDFSEGHSLNGATLGATPEDGLILVVKQGVMPNLEVQTLSGAFHEDKVALPVKIVVVPDFGDLDSKYYAILLDRRGVKVHNTYRAVRENQNGDGDFINYFLHTENTVFVSRNIFVKVYSAS